MRLLASILIVITCCVCPAVYGSQPINKHNVIGTYKKLVEMRNSDSELLLSGNGVMVVASTEKSQLQPLDIILSFNGQPIYSVSNLQQQIAINDPEQDNYTVNIMRAGIEKTIVLKPEEFSVNISNMNPIELGQLIGAMSDSDSSAAVSEQDDMTSQYLKGRPFRTPNNRTGYVKLPGYSSK